MSKGRERGDDTREEAGCIHQGLTRGAEPVRDRDIKVGLLQVQCCFIPMRPFSRSAALTLCTGYNIYCFSSILKISLEVHSEDKCTRKRVLGNLV